jgi:hypothetical protein
MRSGNLTQGEKGGSWQKYQQLGVLVVINFRILYHQVSPFQAEPFQLFKTQFPVVATSCSHAHFCIIL